DNVQLLEELMTCNGFLACYASSCQDGERTQILGDPRAITYIERDALCALARESAHAWTILSLTECTVLSYAIPHRKNVYCTLIIDREEGNVGLAKNKLSALCARWI